MPDGSTFAADFGKALYGGITLETGNAREEENTVDLIDLVLGNAGGKAGEVQFHGVPSLVIEGNAGIFRTDDINLDAGHRDRAFPASDLGAARRENARIVEQPVVPGDGIGQAARRGSG